MNKIATPILAAALALGGASTAQADELLGMGVTLKGGTLGYGLELTKAYNPTWSARVGFNTLSVTDTMTQDDIDYDAELDLSTIAIVGDWHPFEGGFRLSLGYVINNNEFKLTATPSSNQQIGDNTYTPSQIGTLAGTVTFDNGYYVGLGWGSAGSGSGLGFSADLGVIAQGSPAFDLKASGGALGSVPQADLDREAAKAEDDMSEFKLYPAIAIGISYSF